MTKAQRMISLFVLLAISAGLAISAQHSRPDTSKVVVAVRPPPENAKSMTPRLHAILSRQATRQATDAFATRDWTPPPPPAPPAAPPPPPSAPTLPFAYRGKQLVDGEWSVFLSSERFGDLIVKAGDVIENIYQVETVSPTVVQLTYLPLHQTQQLAIGNTP